MPLFRRTPSPPLDRHVACLWWSHRDHHQPHGEHLLPTGTVQLIIALHDTPFVCRPRLTASTASAPIVWSRSIVHGPQRFYYRSDPKPPGTVVGVAFKPGGAAAILDLPAAELTDRHVTLEELWGLHGRALQEHLCDTHTPSAALEILEHALRERLTGRESMRPLLIHPAVAHALASPELRIADLRNASGYSARHFIALFNAAVGLPPKYYSRLQRFGTVVRRLAASPTDLAAVAAETGYADQAHMTREFRDLAGITPTHYRPSTPDAPMHHRHR